jgi:hypothetical protein
MTKKTKNNNPYAGKTKSDLVKSLGKLESEYQHSLAKGKLAADTTPDLRKQRARLLTALNQTN